MATNDKDQKLNRVVQDAEDLLEQLDDIKVLDKPIGAGVELARKREQSKPTDEESKQAGGFNKVLAVLGMVSGLFGLLIILAWMTTQNTTANKGIHQQQVEEASSLPPTTESEQRRASNSTPDEMPSTPSSTDVYFNGIDLPITNRLCNKKDTFCINDLANLVESKKGIASYSYTDIVKGERVDIIGQISIANLEQSADGTPTFTFAFKDDQAQTTPGWAASGFFSLDQDATRPGILVRFKTTESFGPKTPVGLENTSYLFPS